MYYFVSLDISFSIFLLWISLFFTFCSRTMESNNSEIYFNMDPHK